MSRQIGRRIVNCQMIEVEQRLERIEQVLKGRGGFIAECDDEL